MGAENLSEYYFSSALRIPKKLQVAKVCFHAADLAQVTISRDNTWIADHLDYVWDRYFNDVPQVNKVDPAFGQPWKTRLGLIMFDQESGISYIRLNALMRLDVVPESVTTITLAHEVVHYAHGFGSQLPQIYRYSHQGGIVDQELTRRGFDHLIPNFKEWADYHYWSAFHMRYAHIFS